MMGVRHEEQISVEAVRQLLRVDGGWLFWREARFSKNGARRLVAAGDRAGWVVVRRGGRDARYRVGLFGAFHQAPRVIWALTHGAWPPPEMQVDHIDGNPLNNDPSNLRLACNSKNHQNQRVRRDSKTGLKGVHVTRGGRYQSKIFAHNKTFHLGTYDTPEEASAAYADAATKYFGVFARRAP